MSFCTNWLSKTFLASILVPMLSSVAIAADPGSAQLFTCNGGTNAQYQSINSHDKLYQLGKTLGRVAVFVDDGSDSSGSCGMNVVPVRQPFSFISWYYNDGNSKSLKYMTARYCFSRKDGTSLGTVDVPGGSYDRGGNVRDGWKIVVQDNRAFPSEVQTGNAYLDRVCFIFSGQGNAANITMGDVEVTSNRAPSYIKSLDMTKGGCQLEQNCPVAF